MRLSLRNLAIVLFCLGSATAAAGATRPLRVMSFNVRYPNPDDGRNIWANRRSVFIATVRRADPDIIGTQELFRVQGDDVVRALPRLRWFGRDRFGRDSDEHMGIFYRTDRVRLIRHGDFWLSATPDTPGSLGWGATLPRMANWGVFETRAAPRYRFLLLDTHLANRDVEDEVARRESASLIVNRLPTLAHGLPIVLTGDFNATPDSAAYRTVTTMLTDTRRAAPRTSGPTGTFHDFTGRPQDRIDYVLVRGFRALDNTVVTRGGRAGVFASDHFPVVVDLVRSR